MRRVTDGAGDVDDIVHATCLAIPKLAARFDRRPSARSWLVGIAVRTALRHVRSSRRGTCLLARFAEVVPEANCVDPEMCVVGRARLLARERAIMRLSSAKRGVSVVVELEGNTHAEVARHLGIPIATVRTRFFHAKYELANALRETGGR